MSLLKLSAIDYHLHNITVLSNVSISLNEKETVGILGINGAGKSTILKIAAGILIPSNGIRTLSHSASVGFVPEKAPLLPDWKVIDYLKHIANIYGLPSASQSSIIEKVIHQLNLAPVIHKYCKSLSKGNQQRVAIAQALIQKPDILILDEPTSGLDPQQIHNFRNMLNELKSETSIIFSSHIMQEVVSLCDSVIVIHEGKNVEQCDISDENTKMVITFLDPVDDHIIHKCPTWEVGTLNKHQFKCTSPRDRNTTLEFCFANNLSILAIGGNSQVLEDKFLALIGC